MSSIRQPRRAYDSGGRRAQAAANRARMLGAARDLFVARGYAGTSVAQIAAAAGVSVPTVFAAFKSKVNLLKEALDTTVVGDAEPVPLAQRPQARRVYEAPTAAEVVRRFGELIVEIAPRTYPVYAVVQAAADSDPQIAGIARAIDEQRLVGAGRFADALTDRLGEPDPRRRQEIRDGIWTLTSPLLYGLLVVQRGWSVQQYAGWVTTALAATAGVDPDG